MSQKEKPSSWWSGWVWGDHHYEVESVPQCNRKDGGCSAEFVFESMTSSKSYVTPTRETGPVKSGDTTSIPKLGTVEHTVNKDTLTVTNTTRPDHLLNPGTVVRQVREKDNGDVVIVTTGDGSGLLPGVNVGLASYIWEGPDQRLKQDVQDKLSKEKGGRKDKD